jgi:hypothetical protein
LTAKQSFKGLRKTKVIMSMTMRFFFFAICDVGLDMLAFSQACQSFYSFNHWATHAQKDLLLLLVGVGK